ncbi:hypothetical protein HNR23_002936 [Nocardiopsis mwathae]|uniref:Uncharacterized protein n=1 Tax=Nocardiopsis mwathae TaxID=1472723 RepID=A0A7W9YJV4_9ACTN|nr:hypothetical protein [Nocardiopsis mwathae]MBB6172876.1 hypothetical protein [Nocardiopsis mwathae]
MFVLVEVCFEFRWRDQVDLSVQPAVVEPVDVPGHRDLQLIEALPRAPLRMSSALNSEWNASASTLP